MVHDYYSDSGYSRDDLLNIFQRNLINKFSFPEMYIHNLE